MNFNPDSSMQAQEVIFSREHQKISHPSIYFNNNSIESVSSQKHLGMILDTKLNFQEHIKNILNKVNKTTGLLRKLQNILPRGSLLTIFKSFVRPHLIAVMLYMTRVIIILFIRKWSQYNITQH